MKAHGFDRVPNEPPVFVVDQRYYLNTWAPPAFAPAPPGTPAPYPTLDAVLHHVTQGDLEGRRWLEHWLAYKVQRPEALMKVAVTISTRPGGGKGTLAFAMSWFLGPDNCYVIEGSRLANRFNAQWADRLFILADEVKAAENTTDISQQLKTFIDSNLIELEGKGQNQRSQKNRTAWLFASNDRVTPVTVESGDRRYTVFANHDELRPEYVAMLNTSFEADRVSPTPSFRAELAGFYRYLLDLVVDRALISRPYASEARNELIAASLSSHEAFVEHVNLHGVDSLLEDVLLHDNGLLTQSRGEWEFGGVEGETGLATHVLYRCYVVFCRNAGMRPLKLQKFGMAVSKHWPKHRFGSTTRVNGYVVRRQPEPRLKAIPPTPAPVVPTNEHAAV